MRPINYPLPLLFLVLCYAAITLLFYQQDMLFAIQDFSVWQNGTDFFRSCISRPYGLLQWSACLLTQFFYYPCLGVAVLMAVWGISGYITHRALRLPLSSAWLIPLPVFCLLIPFTQMGYWLYIVKLSAFWYLPTLLWLWWSVMLWLMFGIERKALRYGACLLWLCVITPWNGLLVHPFDSIDAFMLIPHKLLVVVLVFQLVARYGARYYSERRRLNTMIASLSIPALGFALVWSVMLNYRNPSFHSELRMERMVERGDWQAIIDETGRSARKPTLNMILLRDLSLLHTGRLDDDRGLSCDGVRPDMLHGPKVYLCYTGGPMIYYLAGYVNDAYRWTLENAMEYGYTPQRLRILLLCAMQNHEWDLARKYVRLLRQTFFHKDFADSLSPLIGHPERFGSFPLLHAVGKIKQRETRLMPALVFMEPLIFNDNHSPLKNHRQCHFEGKQLTY